jgi:hypothetical protein
VLRPPSRGARAAAQVRFIISIRGAALGSLCTLALPALVLLRAPTAPEHPSGARVYAKALVLYGAVSSVVGTAACLLQG